MEFYHFNQIESDFHLKLSDKDLWDFVKAGKLQPFIKNNGMNFNYGKDPMSGSYSYHPTFPDKIIRKYIELKSLRNKISENEEYLSKSDEEHWKEKEGYCRYHEINPGKKEDYIDYVAKLKRRSQAELDELKPKAHMLEEEFKDIARLYENFTDTHFSDLIRENFLEDIKVHAYYRRDQIEALLNQSSNTETLKTQKGLLPCPKGTQWENIKITLIADDTVRIKTPQGEERFTYSELGFSDKRKGDSPTVLWVQLTEFAKHKGIISGKDSKYIKQLPIIAKRLNKHLQELFGLPDTIYKAHYRKYHKYETKIQFQDSREPMHKRPDAEPLKNDIEEIFQEGQRYYIHE